MNKTIIRVSTPDGSNDNIFELIKPDLSVPGAKKVGTLSYKDTAAFKRLAKAMLPKDGVKAAGKTLYESLCVNKNVEAAFNETLKLQLDQQAPIYIQIEDPGLVDSFPWEALYSTPIDDFLGLDKRWPIGRIAGHAPDTPDQDYSFVLPLRMLVVLTAVGVQAEPEWQALLTAASQAPFAISLRVFVCEKTLLKRIQKDKQAMPHLDVEVSYFVNKTELFAAVKDFQPNILHFFCHGNTDGGAHLNLATISDWETNQESNLAGTVVETKDFLGMEDIRSHVWLVTLNCCLAGSASKGSPSLARTLVDSGFPAVVGMGDVIASDDANTFCQILYATLFAQLQIIIGTDCTLVGLELVKVFSQVREQLRDKHVNGELPTPSTVAANRKEWMLPILYVQPGTFQLRTRTFKPALTPEVQRNLLAQLKVFTGLRDTMKDTLDTPTSLIEKLDAQISDFEAQLFV